MKELHIDINEMILQIKLMEGTVIFGCDEMESKDRKLLVKNLQIAVQKLDKASYLTMEEIKI